MSLLIDGQDNPDAAWYYPDPKPAATQDQRVRGVLAGVDVWSRTW